MKKLFSFFILLSLFTGCISGLTNKNKKMDQLQLQEEIQRFYTRFTERVIESIPTDISMKSALRTDSLRQYLLYDSEALKITTSPYPETNLLDMLVFIKLNRYAVKHYWMPKVYGNEGIQLLHAFLESENDLTEIALKVLDIEDIHQVDRAVRGWIRQNPGKYRFEKIRLSDFAKYAEVKQKDGISFSLSNLLVDTKSATQAVDQAILVANRAIFLTQNMPLIVRLHTRLGTQEIIGDTVSTFQGAPAILDEVNQTRPLIQSLTTLASEFDQLVRDSQKLLDKSSTSLPKGININESFGQLDSILTKSTNLIKQLQSTKGINPEMAEELKDETYTFIWFIALMVIFVSFCIAVIWWSGYYISKRLLMRRALRGE
jgi:hypothetical protein